MVTNGKNCKYGKMVKKEQNGQRIRPGVRLGVRLGVCPKVCLGSVRESVWGSVRSASDFPRWNEEPKGEGKILRKREREIGYASLILTPPPIAS